MAGKSLRLPSFTPSPSSSSLSCPLCGSIRIVYREDTGEYVCPACGAVVASAEEATILALEDGALSIESQFRKTRQDDLYQAQTFTVDSAEQQPGNETNSVNPTDITSIIVAPADDSLYVEVSGGKVILIRTKDGRVFKKAEATISANAIKLTLYPLYKLNINYYKVMPKEYEITFKLDKQVDEQAFKQALAKLTAYLLYQLYLAIKEGTTNFSGRKAKTVANSLAYVLHRTGLIKEKPTYWDAKAKKAKTRKQFNSVQVNGKPISGWGANSPWNSIKDAKRREMLKTALHSYVKLFSSLAKQEQKQVALA